MTFLQKQSMQKKLLFSKLTGRTPLLLFLATGTCVTLAAQAVSDLVSMLPECRPPPLSWAHARPLQHRLFLIC